MAAQNRIYLASGRADPQSGAAGQAAEQRGDTAGPRTGGPAAEPEARAPGFSAGKLRVAIIDAVRFSRDCLVTALRALEPELSVVGCASVAECLRLQHGSINTILVYSHAADPFEAALQQNMAALRTGLPETPTILLTDSPSVLRPAGVRDVIQSGVRGVIPAATMEMRTVIAAMRLVQAGSTFAPVEVLVRQPDSAASSPDRRELRQLTSRQLGVLAGLRAGKANKSIAEELGIKESTVKTHVRSIIGRLGVSNRTQAAFRADDYLRADRITRLMVR